MEKKWKPKEKVSNLAASHLSVRGQNLNPGALDRSVHWESRPRPGRRPGPGSSRIDSVRGGRTRDSPQPCACSNSILKPQWRRLRAPSARWGRSPQIATDLSSEEEWWDKIPEQHILDVITVVHMLFICVHSQRWRKLASAKQSPSILVPAKHLSWWERLTGKKHWTGVYWVAVTACVQMCFNIVLFPDHSWIRQEGAWQDVIRCHVPEESNQSLNHVLMFTHVGDICRCV